MMYARAFLTLIVISAGAGCALGGDLDDSDSGGRSGADARPGPHDRRDVGVGDGGRGESDSGATSSDIGGGDDLGTDFGNGTDGGDAGTDADAGALPADPDCIFGGPTVGQLGLTPAVVGGAGGMHVAAAGDAVRYFHRPAGGAWTTEIVAPQGDAASIALRASGEPVIVFADRSQSVSGNATAVLDIRLALRSNGNWTIVPLSEDATRSYDGAIMPDVRVAPDGTIYASYEDYDAGSFLFVEVATYSNGVVTTEHVDLGGEYYSAVRLAVGPDSEPLVALLGPTKTHMLERDASGWSAPESVPVVDPNTFADFLVDDSGEPIFVTPGASFSDYAITRRSNGAWSTQECSGDSGGGLAAAVLDDGTISTLRYARLSGDHRDELAVTNGCASPTPIPGSHYVRPYLWTMPEGIGGPKILVLREAGYAVGGSTRLAVFHDDETGELEAMWSDDDGAAWTRDELLASQAVGFSPSVAISGGDDPVVATVDAASWTPWLVEYDGAGWTSTEIDLGADCAAAHAGPGAIDVAVDGIDVYVVGTRRCGTTRVYSEPFVKKRINGVWSDLPNFDFEEIGEVAVSIAIDASGEPVVTVADDWEGAQYTLVNGMWQETSIPGNFGDLEEGAAHVALDGQDRVYVSHAVPDGVRVLGRRDESDSFTEELSADADGNMMHGMDVDAAGQVLLSFPRERADTGDWELFFARVGPAGVSTEEAVSTVSDGARTGVHGAAVVDGPAGPLAVYHDAWNQALQAAVRSNATWSIATLDDGRDLGWYPDVAVDSTGTAWAAYLDRANLDLCVVGFDAANP